MDKKKIKYVIWGIIIVLIICILFLMIENIILISGNMPVINMDDILTEITDKYKEYRTKVKREQRENKKNKRNNKKRRERVKKYYNFNIKSETQNVHNPQVVHDMKEKYHRLCELIPDKIPIELENIMSEDEWLTNIYNITFDEISKKIDNEEAMDVLEKIRESNTIINSLDATEIEILSKIWRRINNVDCNFMIENMILLLKEIGQERSVCPQGRIARMMSIFIHIDPDPILRSPIMDTQSYMKEAFDKTYQTLQNMINDEDMRKIYNKLNLTSDEQIKLDKFKEHVRKSVEKILTDDYENIMTDNSFKKLLEECDLGLTAHL